MKSEIEAKARVKDGEILIARLQEIGCELSTSISQDDQIYNLKGLDISKGLQGTAVLRIREQEGRIIFNLKKDRSNELDCTEREVDVSDKKALEDIINLLGFEKTVEVHKKRRKGRYGEYEICLDEVEGLGSFVEVEKMSDEDGQKVQDELFAFLQTLGVDSLDRVTQGYDTQLLLKGYQK